MPWKRSRGLLVLLFSLWGLSYSQQVYVSQGQVEVEESDEIWVFLMVGQSNMAGRGRVEAQDVVTNARIITIDSGNQWVVAKEPIHFYESADALDCGMSFAQTLLKSVPDCVTIALVPCAVGGSSVFQWLDDDEHRGVKLFSNFTEKVQRAKKKGVIKGILWHQGESNANVKDIPQYEDGVIQLFNEFREVVGNDELPIIMGEIGHFAEPAEKADYFDQINQIIQHVASTQKNVYAISSQGLDHRGDHLHFNSAGQRELGKRYAAKVISFID